MENTKSAFIAIVGRPNVGKSSLLNAFVGEKVAIVSPKPQTTRTRVNGVLTRAETQLVFVDTPGAHKPRTRLSEYMKKEISQGMAGVDLIVMVTEAAGDIRRSELDLIDNLRQSAAPVILAVNKIDMLARKELMLEKIKSFSAMYGFEHVFPVSATRRDGVAALLDTIFSYAAEGPHYFEDDAYTDQTERALAAEIIREKLLYNLREEIPHGIAVDIESMKERTDGKLIEISAVIYCEKTSHKGMIIGKGGAMLKKIATQAREELEGFLDTKVHLQCWVKIKEDWRNRESIMRQLGFK